MFKKTKPWSLPKNLFVDKDKSYLLLTPTFNAIRNIFKKLALLSHDHNHTEMSNFDRLYSYDIIKLNGHNPNYFHRSTSSSYYHIGYKYEYCN